MLIRAAHLAILAAAAGAMLATTAAHAATVDVQVRTPDGRPVPDAVVTIEVAHSPAGAPKLPGPFVMKQQNLAFVPHVLIVPVGANVTFPNMDRVRHHVYSFSPAKKFQLALYGQDETKSVVFDKPGVIALGCNIHDTMSGFILAVATPYAAKTDAAGHAVIADVPPGAVTLRLWSPLIRAPGNALTQSVALPAAGLTRTIAIGS
jgi:plastocyanin